MLLGIILAFLSGFVVVINLIVNSQLAKRIGIFHGAFYNYLIGSIFGFIVFLVIRDTSIKTMSTVPVWAYFGGFIGVFVLGLQNFVVPKIPIVYSSLIMFLGQLFTGLAIDFFIKNSFSLSFLIGGLLILIGLGYNVHIDKLILKEKKDEA